MATSLLASPVRRAGADYASTSGAALVADAIRQLLLTEPGELPWRPRFGAGLEGLLHRGNDEVTAELARVRAEDALRLWLPRAAEVLSVAPEREGEMLRLRIRYRVGDEESTSVVELPASGVVP